MNFPLSASRWRRKLLWLLPLLSFTLADRPAYRLFTAQGQVADYDQMLAQLAQADVVLFGEQHNDPIAHWLELQVAKDLTQAKGPGKLVLGLEMFERDVQPLVAQYAAGTLPDSAFERQSRPWPNYATDYRPLLQFARDEKISVVGTNAPRRYAQQVARGSLTALDKLPANEKAYLAPLPLKVDFELPGYKKMAAMFGDAPAHGGGGGRTIIQAQALKDATMATYIRQSIAPGQLLLHFNGSYHSDNHDGIVAYLRQYAPKLRVKTISTVSQEQLQTLTKENLALADYVLVVPADMTKTY
ncbi:MAG: ChaN family lipoprotein [Janthinobacterium lividum]